MSLGLTSYNIENVKLTGNYYHKKTWFGLRTVLMVEVTANYRDPVFMDLSPDFTFWRKATDSDKFHLGMIGHKVKEVTVK